MTKPQDKTPATTPIHPHTKTTTKTSSKKPDDIDMVVGARLRMLRETRKLTQEQLAAHLGISYQQIQKYESGANRISARNLCRLAQLLQVSEQDFFGENPYVFFEQPVTSDMRTLINRYKNLTTSNKQLLLNISNLMLKQR